MSKKANSRVHSNMHSHNSSSVDKNDEYDLQAPYATKLSLRKHLRIQKLALLGLNNQQGRKKIFNSREISMCFKSLMQRHEVSQDSVHFPNDSHTAINTAFDSQQNKSVESAYSVPSDLE